MQAVHFRCILFIVCMDTVLDYRMLGCKAVIVQIVSFCANFDDFSGTY